MRPELWRNVFSVILLALAEHWPLFNSEHFYGEQLAANLAANGSDLIITISWRLTWNTNKQPTNEKLYTCVSGLGSQCSSEPSYILMEPQTAICTNIVTAIEGFQYVPWTGHDIEVYYPFNKIPANYSTIGMTFIDSNWGLVTAFLNTGNFGGQLIVMTSRRRTMADSIARRARRSLQSSFCFQDVVDIILQSRITILTVTPYGAVGAMQLPSVIVAAKALMGRPIHSHSATIVCSRTLVAS